MSFARAQKNCPDLPWTNDNPDRLGQVITQFAEDHDQYLVGWAQKWNENFQYIHGNHQVRWSRQWGFAVDTDFMRRTTRAINQKSQTNISRTIFEALANMLYGSLPTWDVLAADESSSQARRFQVISQKLLDAYMNRLCMHKEFRTMVNTFTAYGMVAAKVDWNSQAGRIMDIPEFEERETTIMGNHMQDISPFGLMEVPGAELNDQGAPLVEKRLLPKTDEQGAQISTKKRVGDVRVTMLSPFEYRRDPFAQGYHKAKWHEHIKVMDFTDYLKEYGNKPGATKYFEKVRPGIITDNAYKYCIKNFLRMTFVNPISQLDMRRVTQNAVKNVFLRNKVVVIEHYDEPDEEKWPEGRLTVVTNGYCTHVIDEMQYTTNKIDGWHPFVEMAWLQLAPSSISTGPLNDVIAKNRELDILDSITDTSVLRNLGSMYLVKPGNGLDVNKMYGEPGQIHEVNDPMNAVNIVRDPQPIPPIINELRETKKNDAYESSGSGDAIRGDRSKGASSGYMLKQLEEREQRRLTPARQEIEAGVSTIGEKILACLKQNALDLDDDVYGYLKRSAAGQFAEKDIMAFLATPLDYGIDVKVEAGSMIAKSKASEQATLIDLIKNTPASARLENDAEVLDKFLKKFDAEVLRDGSSAHRERARRENEIFRDAGRLGPNATGLQLPVVAFVDDDDLHISDHERDMVENWDELQNNPFELYIRTQHVEMHRLQKKEKMGEVPPGTTQNGRQLYAQAAGTTAQSLGIVYNKQVQNQQAQQQQAVQAQMQKQQASGGGEAPAPGSQPGNGQSSGNGKNAAAPSMPKAPGAPSAPMNDQAPSANVGAGRNAAKYASTGGAFNA